MSASTTHQMPVIVQKLTSANEQAWLTLGSLAEMMADWERAMASYEYALRHNPYSINALTQIASLCRGREQFAKAVEYFKRILALQETNGDTWSALGHCYLMMENLQDAYQAYQQALYHLPNPKDPKLWYGIGILYDRYGSIEHAEEAFSAVLKMDPDFEKANEIYFRLGIIYKQQQKYDLSLQCFGYIFHNPPRPLTETDIWFQTGHVYEQQKEYELAKDAYERVLADNPDHAKVLQQLGWLYHQPNTSFSNQTQAVDYLTRSLKADGTDAQSWYLLGRCYMAEQNYNKAYESYQQAVYRDARNPTFWCSIGVLYYQINQYRDALDAYSRAIRLNPFISEVWYDLGTLYESCSNQTQDAMDAYQRASELDPNNSHIRQRLDLLRKAHAAANSGSGAVTVNLPATTPMPQDVHNPYQYGPDTPQTSHPTQFTPQHQHRDQRQQQPTPPPPPPPLVGGLQHRLPSAPSKPTYHDRRHASNMEPPRELTTPGERRTTPPPPPSPAPPSSSSITSSSTACTGRFRSGEHSVRIPDISDPTPSPHERLPHMERSRRKGLDDGMTMLSRGSSPRPHPNVRPPPPLPTTTSNTGSSGTYSPRYTYTDDHPPSSRRPSGPVKVDRPRTAHDETNNAAGTLMSLARKIPERRSLPSSHDNDEEEESSKRPKLSPISTRMIVNYESSTLPSEPRSPSHHVGSGAQAQAATAATVTAAAPTAAAAAVQPPAPATDDKKETVASPMIDSKISSSSSSSSSPPTSADASNHGQD